MSFDEILKEAGFKCSYNTSIYCIKNGVQYILSSIPFYNKPSIACLVGTNICTEIHSAEDFIKFTEIFSPITD